MNNNLLQYPDKTIVDQAVKKTAFYRKATITPRMRDRFVDELQELRWLYKLAPITLNVEATKEVEEIEIFHASLKQQSIPTELLRFIDTILPHSIIFILQFQDRYCLFVNYKRFATQAHDRCEIIESFFTDWTDALPGLAIQGRSLSAIYDNFVRQIAGTRLEKRASLLEDVATMQRREAITKRITQLETAMNKEVQPHRKFELHQQILRLKNELNAI